MLLRDRWPGPSSADRVAGLLASPSDGWLPPDDGEGDRRSASGPGEVPGADRAPGRVELPVPDQVPEQSWSVRGRHSTAAPRSVAPLRLDVSRRAAVALLLVAALAAVAAAAVVLRGRPQEVAVPVLEASGVPLPGASALPGGPAPGAPAAAGPSGGAPAGPAGAAGPVGAAGEVVVSVGGAVARPGLVRLPAGSRVDDAVRAAGGPVDPAAAGLLNLARRLVDGEQVLVGVTAAPGAAGAAPTAAGGGAVSGGPLDLNTASVTDLDALPGIGPVLAQRIVAWRTANGRFASVDQLREVTGIGEATFAELEPVVSVP